MKLEKKPIKKKTEKKLQLSETLSRSKFNMELHLQDVKDTYKEIFKSNIIDKS